MVLTFSNKFSGTSSLGSSPQKYTLPTGIEGRYVRVTVNGNTENEWASITEISVLGGASGGSGGGGSNLIGTLFHKWQTGADSGTWSTYSFLNGEIRSNSDLALAMNNDGRLQVFMIGTDNALYYKTQTGAGSSSWTSSWTSLGGAIREDTSPAVARNNDGRVQVFMIGTDNALYYKTQTAAGQLYVVFNMDLVRGHHKRHNTDPVVIANSDGRLQVFVIGTNNQIYYRSQTEQQVAVGWTSSWTSLGGAIREDTSPAVARNNDGRVQVFMIGTDNALYYKTQTGAGSSYVVFNMDLAWWSCKRLTLIL